MCSKALTKFILIAFNVVFVILGIVVLTVGLWAKFDSEGFAYLFSHIPSSVIAGQDVVDVPALISSASISLIIGGIFMLIVGFLGCFGAMKEVYVFLLAYSIILLMLIVLEVAFLIVTYWSRNTTERNLLKYLEVTINNGYVGGTGYSNGTFSLSKDATTLAWDVTQFSLECCGARDGFTDYKNASNWDHKVSILDDTGEEKEVTAKVPLSCCKLVDPSVFPNTLEAMEFVDAESCLKAPSNDTANILGCFHAVEAKFLGYSMISGGVAFLIALVEICGLICACWLYKSLQKGKGYEQQE